MPLRKTRTSKGDKLERFLKKEGIAGCFIVITTRDDEMTVEVLLRDVRLAHALIGLKQALDSLEVDIGTFDALYWMHKLIEQVQDDPAMCKTLNNRMEALLNKRDEPKRPPFTPSAPPGRN